MLKLGISVRMYGHMNNICVRMKMQRFHCRLPGFTVYCIYTYPRETLNFLQHILARPILVGRNDLIKPTQISNPSPKDRILSRLGKTKDQPNGECLRNNGMEIITTISSDSLDLSYSMIPRDSLYLAAGS